MGFTKDLLHGTGFLARKERMHLFLWLNFALFGCGGSEVPVSWTGPEDCEARDPGPLTDECWAAVLPDLFLEDRARAEKLVDARIQDVRIRDFVWLTITRDVDPGSYRWCDRIEDKALADRCRVLVSRPHLHRELVRQKGGKVPPHPGSGQRPPGSGAPPAPK